MSPGPRKAAKSTGEGRDAVQQIPIPRHREDSEFLKRAEVKAGYLSAGRVMGRVFLVAKMLAAT